MGFPSCCYNELLLPKLLLHFLSIFSLLRRLVSSLLRLAGLPDFLDSPTSSPILHSAAGPSSWPDSPFLYDSSSSLSFPAALLREILPLVKLSDLSSPPETCAVCLYEFEPQQEARRLPNCCHVFHRGCLDRWISYGQRTCPLCRTSLVPDEFADTINQGLWAASGIADFHDDFDQFHNPLLIHHDNTL